MARTGHAVGSRDRARRHRCAPGRGGGHHGAETAPPTPPAARDPRGRESLQRRERAAHLSHGGRCHDRRLLLRVERAADAAHRDRWECRTRARAGAPYAAGERAHSRRRDRGGVPVLRNVLRVDSRRAASPLGHHHDGGLRDGGGATRRRDHPGAHSHPVLGGVGGGGVRAERARLHPRGLSAQVHRGSRDRSDGIAVRGHRGDRVRRGHRGAHRVGNRRGGVQPVAVPPAPRWHAWPA